MTFTVSLRNRESYLESVDVLNPKTVKAINSTLILFDRFYNTKFNEYVGEPIVNTPEQSYQMLVKTDMDYLVMGNFLIKRDL